MSPKNTEDHDFENEVINGSAEPTYDESYEDDVSYSDDDSGDWSDDGVDEEPSNEASPPPEKKKTSVLTIVIITVVAVVGVLGFMILSGGNVAGDQTAQEGRVAINADPDSTQEEVPAEGIANVANLQSQKGQQQNLSEQANPADPTNMGQAQNVPAQPDQGLMNDPEILGSQSETVKSVSGDQVGQPAMTAPVDMAAPENLAATAVEGQLANVNELPVVSPVANNSEITPEITKVISPNVQPVSDFPTVDSIKKDNLENSDVAAPSSAQSQISDIQMEINRKLESTQTELKQAQDKIVELEKAISAKDAELLDIQSKQQNVETSVVSESEVEALKAKIVDLEKRLVKNETVEKDLPVIRERAESDVTEPKSQSKVVKEASTSSTKTDNTPHPASIKAVKSNWILKSASSGKAILSDKMTGDLKTVSVGDNVRGLGRIVSITNGTSGWVVKATEGSVSE